MNKILVLLFFTILIGCMPELEKKESFINYIPRKASVIIKSNDFNNLNSFISNQGFLEKFSDTKLGKNAQEFKDFLAHFTSEEEVLIAFTKVGKEYDLSMITKNQPTILEIDSTQATITKIQTTTPQITKIAIDNKEIFTITLKDAFIASTSQLLLENSIREKESLLENDIQFNKAFQLASSKAKAQILIRGEEAGTLFKSSFPKASHNPLDNAFGWTQLDLGNSNADLIFNGVVLTDPIADNYLRLFNGITPIKNKVAQMMPLTAQSATSITISNWENYKNNLADYEKIDPSKFDLDYENIISLFKEVALIQLDKESAFAAFTSLPEETSIELRQLNTTESSFREIPIFNIEEKGFEGAFAKAYKHIFKLPNVKVYAILDGIFLFAENQEALENLIVNYQNKATLQESKMYQNTASQLSDASSVLYIANNKRLDFNGLFESKEASKMDKISFEKYPFSSLQLIQDSDFMLLNGVINKNENLESEGTIVQVASTKLEYDIAMPPQLVKNHRTKGMDIVVQDQNNSLYLLSNKGSVLWQKELDGTIQGKVQQVDLYRNGRLQLAFVTDKTFYILDRNGNEVAPFPISFKDDITQPLSIFDYEKNRKYRFVLTQGKVVQMFDKEGKIVKGFTFKEATNEIVLPPQHLRIGNKDYITVAESNGKLNILSRTGKTRVAVPDRINFGENLLFKDGNNFGLYDVNGEKISINSSGKVTQQATDYGAVPIVKSGKNIAAIRENNLFINDRTIELDYGTYPTPSITSVKKKKYIGFLNEETKEIYMYNSKGALLDNFPVYGYSSPSTGFLERDKSLGFTTQGDSKTVLIYKIN